MAFIKMMDNSDPLEPKYRKGKYNDNRAIVASDGRGTICIDHIGGGIQYDLEGGMTLEEIFRDAPLGISVWHGKYHHDEGLDGDYRPLTDEEWKAWAERGEIWDSNDWFEETSPSIA